MQTNGVGRLVLIRLHAPPINSSRRKQRTKRGGGERQEGKREGVLRKKNAVLDGEGERDVVYSWPLCARPSSLVYHSDGRGNTQEDCRRRWGRHKRKGKKKERTPIPPFRPAQSPNSKRRYSVLDHGNPRGEGEIRR